MAFEETTSDPLVDVETNYLDEVKDTGIVVFVEFSSLNSLVEVHIERLEGVLVHVVYDAELNEQEVEHSTLSSYSSVNFTRLGNSLLSLLSNNLLLLDGCGSLLGNFKSLNESKVLKNGGRIGVRQVLEELLF